MWNKDEVEGKFKRAKGIVKDKVGEWTGDEQLEQEGEVERATGEVQENIGTVRRKAGEVIEKVGEKIARR